MRSTSMIAFLLASLTAIPSSMLLAQATRTGFGSKGELSEPFPNPVAPLSNFIVPARYPDDKRGDARIQSLPSLQKAYYQTTACLYAAETNTKGDCWTASPPLHSWWDATRLSVRMPSIAKLAQGKHYILFQTACAFDPAQFNDGCVPSDPACRPCAGLDSGSWVVTPDFAVEDMSATSITQITTTQTNTDTFLSTSTNTIQTATQTRTNTIDQPTPTNSNDDGNGPDEDEDEDEGEGDDSNANIVTDTRTQTATRMPGPTGLPGEKEGNDGSGVSAVVPGMSALMAALLAEVLF